MLVTRAAILLTGLVTMSGVVRAGAAAVPQIATVRTLEELRQATPHRLTNGWAVRLGLGEPGAEAGPWKLLYCPGMTCQLPRTRVAAERLRSLASADAAVARVPLLSNRLDLVLTEGLLEWHERRFRERDTEF